MANNYFLRTDILPFEIPSLFSNSQLYRSSDFTENKLRKIINFKISKSPTIKGEKEFANNYWKYGYNTKPLYFVNKVSSSKTRKMSLLHPGGQIRSFYFILEFEDDILDHMDSNFSFRLPKKRNKNIIDETKKEDLEIKKISTAYDFHSGIYSEENIANFLHYFNYSWSSSFAKMVTHPKVKAIQLRYQFSKKIDLQNFFPSIYTHSLAWALLGSKSVAKYFRKEKNKREYFENKIDSLMTEINFDETNGIVVGPEFSRIIAELLLVRVDKIVESTLWKKYSVKCDVDYSIVRFVDDIFIFSNSVTLNNNIQDEFSHALQNFNLSLNDSKIKDYDDSETIFYSKVAELKQIFLIFSNTRSNELIHLQQQNMISKEYELKSFLGTSDSWDVFFKNILRKIYETPERKDILVNYALSTIPSLITFSKINLSQIMTILGGSTSILKINVCFKSIHHYILLLSNIVTKLDELVEKTFEFELMFGLNIDESDTNVKIISFIFHHVSQILDSKWFIIGEGYELISFMEFFKKYNLFIPTHTLQAFLKNKSIVNEYFVLTTITNYIYNPKLKNILTPYRAVYKSIYACLFKSLEKYSYEGINEIDNGNFFYLINDFYYFPGDSKLFKESIVKHFSTIVEDITNSPLSTDSFFQWGKPFKFFLREVIRKKIINRNINSSDLSSI